MSPVIAESASSPGPPLTLSTRLIHELCDPSSTLRATTDRRGAAVIINAGGEVDACNERTWCRLVSEAAGVVIPPGPLVVDVTGLDFMACCGFAVLADEARRCKERGVELRLVSCDPVVARVVDACGLNSLLPVYPTADAALATSARW
ncbi:anti-sigma factor antagonist [Mycobacterium sp.]|uniref:anti-sigma factor antagonist n=1 Tax=Mycobacterium sp. TaxID=1785 RepID=UPI0025CD8FC2|nr:anti-sigma factor antagonist [Mycobacterium sp.]MBW0013635.1 anti-sigma factor antagonist [Mycobacterium sp.]